MISGLKQTLAISILFALALLSSASGAAGEAAGSVRIVEIDGAIDPIVATYLVREIQAAEKLGDPARNAIMIRMDTPGGLDISMREIIQKILGSRVPVIVYTAPSGARAASAGAVISLSAHVAAMAPGTNIGAAHPVNLGGENGGEVGKKVENDAAAFVRSIAKQRGRNVKWAEDAVRKSVSATASEAKKLNVIDFIADSDRDVLRQAAGLKVKVKGDLVELDLAKAKIVRRPMGLRQRFLHAVINPNIVFILMMLGVYGIIYEMANPGFGFAGIGGAIVLITALYGLQALPFNLAGLALIILAFILFVAEAMTPTFGVLAGGGLMSLIMGAAILFDAPRAQLGISGWVIVPIAGLTLAFVLVVVRAAWHAHRRRPTTGRAGMIGLKGTAATDLDPSGQVIVHGEVWAAKTIGSPISAKQEIEVVSIEGLKLKVRQTTEEQGEVNG